MAFAVMRLLVICAFAIGMGVLLLIGLWAIANELYSQSIFGVPFEAEGKSAGDHADEEQSASSSAPLVGWRADGWRRDSRQKPGA
jgi:hypothetical protein